MSEHDKLETAQPEKRKQIYGVRSVPEGWCVYRLADGLTWSVHPSFGTAFHAMERLNE